MAAVSSGTFLHLLLFLAIPPTVSGTVLFNITDAVLNRLENNAGPIGLKSTVEGASVQRYSLYIASQLDFETMPNNIQNYVYCTDSTNVQAIRLEVTLFITDVNEFPPGFKDAPYSISLPEGSGQFVTDSAATGIVLLNTRLDFELGPRQYVLTLSAEEYQTPDGSTPKTSYTTLTIKVTDVDEFGPVFSSDVYTLSIAEHIYTGGVYNTDPPLRAVDDDATKENIIITTDNSTSLQVRSHFSVLANGSLVVIGNVTRGQYSLNVRAYQINRPADRMNVASVLITVFDLNDHAPVMSSATYTVRIPEDASPGAIIATVFASDADVGENSSFSFYLSDNSIFTISTENAVGVVKLVGRLESTSSFTVQVYAQEDKSVEKFRSNNSTLVINVTDVNDNNPVFVNTTYSFSVPQTAAKGQEIGQVNAADKDAGPNGQVSYRLSGAYGIEEGTFVVDSATGRVVLSRNLTRRDVGVAVLAIEAYDGATEGERRSSMAQVQVKITSVNLSPPVFNSSTYTFTVLETSPVGFRVGAVAASDMDNDSLLYTLNNDTDFQLQGNPPALYLKSVLDLDSASRGSVYVLKVQVTDGDYSSTATVSVTVEHVNEYEPVWNQTVYTFQVLENATSGSFVQKITASDKDSGSDGTVMYSISPGVGPFIINPSTGVLTISCSTLTCLDYESETQYVIIVNAIDGGQPAKTSAATIIITVINCNDEKPQFASDFTGSVTENLPPGFTILLLQASDLDTPEKDLVFSLSSVVPPGVIRVDNLYVVTNVSLDAEKTRVITGLVHVTDGLHTSTAALSISVQDVNDNAPQVVFTVNPVEIPEKATTGAKVLVVNVTDADVTNSGFTFWLEGAEGKFAIDHTTGTITVSGAFDRRVQNHYNVQVWVSDQGAPPRLNHSLLYINVTDSNTSPTFVNISNSSVIRYRFDVREDAPVGFSVGRVLALDPDPGSSGQVRYVISTGNSDHVFLLGETTGD
ncbi:protocadherin Fat 4-like [Pomacea canaliculata]|uniref:protocadherin Fat 4-like n=1 Tax=Pomacea canaliculata TaxID=400727 RepID=UPI000D72A3AA|nr:protocadherin Fat 4-like [Pomacea canaliculata]